MVGHICHQTQPHKTFFHRDASNTKHSEQNQLFGRGNTVTVTNLLTNSPLCTREFYHETDI